MRRFSFAIAAGETKNFKIGGNYFEVVSATAPVDVEFYDREENQQSNQAMTQGVSGDWQQSEPGKPYAGFKIYSLNAQTLTLFVGTGIGGSKRLPGIVEVIDTAVNRTLAGQAFNAPAFRAGAAATFQYLQLFNPAGSARRLRVDRLTVSLSSAQGINMAITTAALVTLGGQGRCRLSGGADSIAQWRAEDNAANLLTGFPEQSYIYLPTVNDTRELLFRYPVILLPGYGLTMRPSANNIQITSSIEFVEEAI